MDIKIKRINKDLPFPKIINKGEWIDLRASEDVSMRAPQAQTLRKEVRDDKTFSYRDVKFDTTLIPLGIAMQLPKGYEAVLLPRSGTFKNYGIIMTNSQGIIDSSYSGTNDEWKFPAIAFKDIMILEGDRICQFRIQPSQKASVWTKIKWLFTNKIEFVWVDSLDEEDRGGIGSTGVN